MSLWRPARAPALVAAAALAGAVLAVPAAAQAATTPVVLEFTESVRPGEVVALRGSGFGTAAQVWLGVVPPAGTVAPNLALTVLNRSDTAVTAVVPANLPAAVYAVQVRAGTAGSAPVLVNKARVHQVEFRSVAPGARLRLFGRNLVLPGQTPVVRLRDTGTGVELDAPVAAGSAANELRATVPAGVAAGRTYQVRLTNGAGGGAGVAVAPGRVTGIAAPADPYGLKVPWIAGFTFLSNVYNVRTDPRLSVRAVGDGQANDLAAVRGAVAAAKAAGGGVVYLPAGTYKLDGALNQNGLTLGSKVVLRGDGATRTVLNINAPGESNSSAVLIENGATRVGFVDLKIATTTHGGLSTRYTGGPAEIFSLRTAWSTTYLNGVVWSGNQGGSCVQDAASCAGPFAFKDSTVTSTVEPGEATTALIPALRLRNARNSTISGNTVSYRFWRMELDGGRDNVVEGNTYQRENTPGVKTSPSVTLGGLTLTGSVDTAVLRNTITATDDYPFNNDGEGILYETADTRYRRGTATAATATTLTDAGGLGAGPWTGLDVVIVAGPGAGQSRRITAATATTVTVDRAWDVVPTAQSRYALQFRARGILVAGNTLTGSPRGIWFYAQSADDVTITGNRLTDAEGILVRGDQRKPDRGNNFDPLTRIQVTDNVVTRTKAAKAGTSQQRAYIMVSFEDVLAGAPFGTAASLVEVRRNRVQAIRPNATFPYDPGGVYDGYWNLAWDSASRTPVADRTVPAILGTVFDHNTAVNLRYAYTTGTGAHQTVIWSPADTGVTTRLRDLVGTGASGGSVGTVVGP